ncbi:MAG: cytochrome c family protein, partial [Rhodobacteraceae bacterium]|nr:cytochrome c family protein [Paracoccaceae bacterium]
MFDTMTMTKAVGAICGAFLVFLLGGWAAEALYFGGEGGHAEEAQAYTIEVADAGATAGGASAAPAVDYATLASAADPAAGEKIF